MVDFKKTIKQKEAINLLSKHALHTMLFGGSRSGKTFILIYAIFVRASLVKSRHLVLRQNFNHIKTSIWHETIPKVLSICFPDLQVKFNRTDYYILLPNGSEVWCGGLDEEKRIDKILGKEYSTLYFNECSQIPYASVQTAISRLAEKNSLKKKVYYDENPPSKVHWSYWQFIKFIDPADDEPIEDKAAYTSLLMNPRDNMENIDENYLNILKKMPKKERERFLEGKFSDSDDGAAYYAFDPDKHVKPCSKGDGQVYTFCDFNVDPMTSVIAQVVNNELHIFDERFLRNSDTYKMASSLKHIGTIIPDSTGANRKTSGMSDFKILRDAGFTILSVRNPLVVDRVNNINRLFTENRIFIDPSCKKLINDLVKVSWKDGNLDQKGANKLLTHVSDALGYGAWKLFPLRDNRKTSQQQL